MAERHRARARVKADSEGRGFDRAKFLSKIEKGEIWNAERALKARGLPEAWDDLAWALPAEPAKVRVKLKLQTEVADWYEGFGIACADQINAVLRLYMLGILSREIDTPEHFDWRGVPV